MAKKKQQEVEMPQMEQPVVEAPIVKEKSQPKFYDLTLIELYKNWSNVIPTLWVLNSIF